MDLRLRAIFLLVTTLLPSICVVRSARHVSELDRETTTLAAGVRSLTASDEYSEVESSHHIEYSDYSSEHSHNSTASHEYGSTEGKCVACGGHLWV
ncbi:hypothetical protein CYMTET_12023, partial [Cymbomonas tetramitiformis]